MKPYGLRVLALILALTLTMGCAGCRQAAPVVTDPVHAEPETTLSSEEAALPTEETQPTDPELSPDCVHADADADDVCDLCRGELLVELNLFAINDLHGKFNDSANQPGVDELTTYLLSQENGIILSSGDTWQGSSESNLTQGALLTQWFNELGVVAMTLGNHEFDWGETYVESNFAIADFPFLAINIYDSETNELAAYCQPSVLVERSGVQVGIIGAIGDCYSSISGDKSGGFYFKTGNDLTALVKAEAESLRTQGADLIVYSIHDGYGGSGTRFLSDYELRGYYDPSLSDGYVDIVFEGHTHQSYAAKDAKDVWHLQGGGENRGISHARVVYDVLEQTVVSIEGQVVYNETYDDAEPHDMIGDLLTQFADQIAKGDEIVGRNDKYRSGDTLRQLVAELYYQAGMERWGEEYDIVLGGGFISVRNPYNLNSGDVEYSVLQSIFPFDNQLVLCQIRGDSLLNNFFSTKNDNYFIYYEEYGNEVLYTIDRSATYYIVTDTYSSSWGPNQLTEVERYDETTFARDLMAAYIAAGNMESKPLDPNNYTLTDIPTLRDLCAKLVPGGSSKDSYYVRGRIQSISSTKYGNMTIVDEQGNTLYIYGTYDLAGSKRYENMDVKPQVGDTVVLYGSLMHYVNSYGESIYEMTDARVVEIE